MYMVTSCSSHGGASNKLAVQRPGEACRIASTANAAGGLGIASVAAQLMRCTALYMAEAAAIMQRREEPSEAVKTDADMIASRRMLWVRMAMAAHSDDS